MIRTKAGAEVSGYGDEAAFASDCTTGLTKRELFAAMAMQGLIVGIDSPAQEACARLAVRAADYLLAELAKKAGGE
jgi:hypothetical protein